MSDSKKIKKHWNDLSAIEGSSYKTSWVDYYMLQKEIEEFGKHLSTGLETICDFGCNNGYCDFEFLKRFPNLTITGVDYSEKAIIQAKETLSESPYKDCCDFFIGDILDVESYPKKKFDIVIVKRTLINLVDENNQIKAISNLASLIDYGRIILMEPIEENFNKLNRLRQVFSLPNLSQPWHNKYLSDRVLEHISSNFNVETSYNYASSYYILSRVLYPWVVAHSDNSTVDYLSEINRLAMMFPNIGDYGLQQLFILTKKE